MCHAAEVYLPALFPPSLRKTLCALAQGGKAKAKAGGARVARLREAAWQAHAQPAAGRGKEEEEDEEAAQRAAEVACTSALLAAFHAHRDAWERMEVPWRFAPSICSSCTLKESVQ